MPGSSSLRVKFVDTGSSKLRKMTGEQKFMLVWFEDDIGMTRSVDIVPANWIIYDDTVNHLVTPFISECSKANLRILSRLVKSESKPLLSWSKHRISIKGSAKTYAEAEMKLKDLETRDHVFTTDNEIHAAVREGELIKKYKQKGNKLESHDVQAMLAASAFEVTTQKEKTGKKVVTKKKIVSTKEKQFVTPKKKQIISPKNKQVASQNKKQQKNKQSRTVESDSETSGSVYSEESAPEKSDSVCSEESAPERFDDDVSKIIERRQEDATAAAAAGLKSNGRDMRQDEENNSGDVKTLVLDCYRRLSAQIGQLQSVVADLSLRQTEIASGIGTNTAKNITGIDTTMEKYSLGGLPLKTMTDFEVFDNKLQENKSIQKEMINGMSALVSSESKFLIRSARNILQRFMTRDLVLMFTAVRQSGKKKVLKDDTTFYICIRDAILTECNKTPNNPSVKEKQIQEAIGSVINNAKDWEGHRQARAKKQASET